MKQWRVLEGQDVFFIWEGDIDHKGDPLKGFVVAEIRYGVARFGHGPRDEEDARRCAYLSAAAPAMREALRNIENDNGVIPEHVWDIIQKAILKADGGEE